MRLALATFIVACLGLAPTTAHARSVVVVVGDAPAPGELRAIVIETIAERGVRLVRTPDGEICDADATPCAAELAARTGADAALRVDVAPGEPPTVRVRLVPAEGDAVDVSESITDDDVEEATRRAVVRALEVAPPAVGFLMIRTDPSGARVEVDGEAHGTTPVRVSLAPGEHDVRLVHAAGTHERTVTVVAEEELAVEADLDAPASADDEPVVAPGPRQTRSEPSPFNWIIGGALAIGGVVTLISPLSTLAREGQCEESIENVGCVEMVRFGAQSGVLLGIGLAALIAAVVVDVVAPIRVDVAVGTSSARLDVRGRF